MCKKAGSFLLSRVCPIQSLPERDLFSLSLLWLPQHYLNATQMIGPGFCKTVLMACIDGLLKAHLNLFINMALLYLAGHCSGMKGLLGPY